MAIFGDRFKLLLFVFEIKYDMPQQCCYYVLHLSCSDIYTSSVYIMRKLTTCKHEHYRFKAESCAWLVLYNKNM